LDLKIAVVAVADFIPG